MGKLAFQRKAEDLRQMAHLPASPYIGAPFFTYVTDCSLLGAMLLN